MSDNERNFICAVMHDENIIYQSDIHYDDLTDRASSLILRTIKSLSASGNKPDFQTIANQLKDKIELSEIINIYDRGALHVNWKLYHKKLSKEIMTRKIQNVIPLINDMMKEGDEPEDIISKTSEYLDKIVVGFKEYRITGFDELIPDVMKEIEDSISQKKIGLVGIDTGIQLLNHLTGGWKPRELIYIGGRPSDGKSAALNGFILAAANSGHNPGVISVESSLNELIKRMISSDSRVPLSKIKSGALVGSQIAQITERAIELHGRNPHGYDEPNATLQTVVTQARRMVSVYKCDCLFIDYIQQITPDLKTVPRNEQVADMSKSLKALARELNIPIIVAAQLRRPQQGHAGRRPSVDDFGESSQIEKDGDIEILIWHKVDQETDTKESYFLLEKQRDGETRDIPVYFNKEIVRFEGREV